MDSGLGVVVTFDTDFESDLRIDSVLFIDIFASVVELSELDALESVTVEFSSLEFGGVVVVVVIVIGLGGSLVLTLGSGVVGIVVGSDMGALVVLVVLFIFIDSL